MVWCIKCYSINGWVLCNGSNNTPDLRNRFTVGAGNGSGAGNGTGGADNGGSLLLLQLHKCHLTLTVMDPTQLLVLVTTVIVTSTQQNDGNGGYRWWKGGDNDCGSW